ncbi:HNH endonuclease, partial [bacterium]|nr:HNH endonuclease [bacterium]
MAAKRHGYAWHTLSRSVRARHPICQRCHERLSEEVHHVRPVGDGGSIFDPRNLMALCRECHY